MSQDVNAVVSIRCNNQQLQLGASPKCAKRLEVDVKSYTRKGSGILGVDVKSCTCIESGSAFF